MPLQPRLALIPLIACALSAAPALAQDATVIGKDTILPGTGPGTTTGGKGGGSLMQAANEADALKRQGLKPTVALASHLIGTPVRNLGGDSVGKIEDLLIDGGQLKAVVIDVGGFLGIGSKQIAVEPDAVVLRPGGDRFSAILQMGKDTISAAQSFDPAKAIPAK